jgi:hypothetical protein
VTYHRSLAPSARRIGIMTAVTALLAVAAGLAIHSAATAMHAQSRSGFHLREAFADREDGWNEHGAELWFARDAFRLDVWNDGGEDATRASVIIPPHDRTRIFFVRHATRDYYACPLAGLAEAGDAFRIISWPLGDDVSSVTATPTDEIRPVSGWETSAVDLRHAGPDEVWEQDPTDPRRMNRRQVHRDIGTVWLTGQTGIQLGEVRSELRAAIRPYGPSFVLHSMWLLLVYGLDETRVGGLPPGVPVALELERNGQLAASSELRSIERVSLPPGLFEVPAGYVQRACPTG